MEQEPADFYDRVRNAYRDLAAREPKRIVLIDGSRSVDDIENEIWKIISARFPMLAPSAKSQIGNRKSQI
jgi:dTMP kinase